MLERSMNLSVVHKSDFRGGYYTTAEAARLLRMDNSTKVRNWAFGSNKFKPVIERQYSDSDTEIGFLDLIEIRFLNAFRNQGVSLQSLRKAAKNAREILNMRHPFASSMKFIAKRKEIFLVTAESEKDKQLLELTTGKGQFAFYDILEKHISDGVEFDPGTEIAKRWKPEPKKFPNVIVNPHKAYGHPTISPGGIPTRSIYDLFRSEENDLGAVADWFELEISAAEEAVSFEIDIARME